MMSKEDNKFPVLHGGDDLPKYVKWSELSEKWAKKIHYQTLTRLAERGGLSPVEIVLNVERIDSRDIKSVSDERARDTVKRIGFMSAPPEIIVCAAIRYGELLFCGVRHGDRTMSQAIDRANHWEEMYLKGEQGFVTNKGLFFNRIDAWKIAKEQRQIIRRVGHDGPTRSGLFSENLY